MALYFWNVKVVPKMLIANVTAAVTTTSLLLLFVAVWCIQLWPTIHQDRPNPLKDLFFIQQCTLLIHLNIQGAA